MVNGSPYCTYAIRSLKVPPHYKYTGVLIVLKRFQDHLSITEAICAGCMVEITYLEPRLQKGKNHSKFCNRATE